MDSLNANKPAPKSVNAPADENFVIPVMTEDAVVNKRQEHTGTLRVRKVIHQVNEPLSAEGYREVVETTRVPVNQVVQAVEASREVGNMLVIPVYEERLVMQLVLLEEIHVTRQRVAFEHCTSTSLRREEVIVERLDPDTRQWVPEVP